MKKAYHPKIRFHIAKVDGYFLKNGWHNRPDIVTYKKTKVMPIANQIIQKFGQVYIKVSYCQQYCNNGIYRTEEDLKLALLSFTENSLLKFIFKGVK